MQNPTGNETKKCKRLERDKEEGAGRGLGPRPGERRGGEGRAGGLWGRSSDPKSTALAQGTCGGPGGASGRDAPFSSSGGGSGSSPPTGIGQVLKNFQTSSL